MNILKKRFILVLAIILLCSFNYMQEIIYATNINKSLIEATFEEVLNEEQSEADIKMNLIYDEIKVRIDKIIQPDKQELVTEEEPLLSTFYHVTENDTYDFEVYYTNIVTLEKKQLTFSYEMETLKMEEEVEKETPTPPAEETIEMTRNASNRDTRASDYIRGVEFWNDETKALFKPKEWTVNSGEFTEWEGHRLYFGVNDASSPMKWRILDPIGDKVFVLQDSPIEMGRERIAHTDPTDLTATYMGSNLDTYINNKYNSNLLSAEEKAATALSYYSNSAVTGDWESARWSDNFSDRYWFAPSAILLNRSSYGFSPNNISNTRTRPSGEYWLLSKALQRQSDDPTGFGIGRSGALAFTNNSAQALSVLVASELKADSILFISAAEDKNGKNGAVVGREALVPLNGYDLKEYKLTLKAPSLMPDPISIDADILPNVLGDIAWITCTIPASSAGTTLSAIITDSAGNYIYRYGQWKTDLTPYSETELAIDFKLPTNFFNGKYKLKIFTEITNGDKKTDLASPLADVNFETYTVDFYDAGNTPQQIIPLGNMVEKPSDPEKIGHNFIGWYSNQNFSGLYNFASLVQSNKTIYAKWEKKDYTVQFEENGGDTVGDQVVKYEELVPMVTPTRKNYDFKGWYKDENLSTEWIFGTDKVTSNLTLYAGWEATKFDITYDIPSGVNNFINPTQYTCEQTFVLQNITRTGYEFDGWTYDGQAEPVIRPRIEVGSSGNKTFVAHWTPVPYTLSYVLGPGEMEPGNPTEYNIETETFTLQYPTKVGHKFTGWTYTGQTAPVKDVRIQKGSTGNKTYTSNWELEKYKVTFVTNGASNGSLTALTIEYNSRIPEPSARRKTGYTFAGWYKEAALENEWNFASDRVTSAMTLYAKWIPIPYNITYEMNEGTNHASNPATYTIEDEVILTAPTKTGHSFEGWTYDEQQDPQMSVTIPIKSTGHKTYTAHWKIDVYTVNFDSQSGSAVPEQTANYNTKTNKPTDPTREGYRFAGWYTEAGCITEWNFESDLVIKNMTLFAKWEKKFYITFVSNTGVGTMDKIGFYAPDLLELPPNTFTKNNYSFVGWNTKADGSGTAYLNKAILNGVFTSDTTLYAIWKVDTPMVFIDIPLGLSLQNDKANNIATSQNQVKIEKDPNDSAWYPEEDIHIRTNPSITLTSNETTDTYEANLYKADGTPYTDGTKPLMELNVKDENKQSSAFTLKTPINYSKFKGAYSGNMNFIVEFKPKP